MHPEKLNDLQLCNVRLALTSILVLDLKKGFLSPCDYNALFDMKIELEEYLNKEKKSI